MNYHEDVSMIDVELKFEKYLGSFVYDEFEYQDIEQMEDSYIVKTKIPHHPWFLSFLLSFGSGVEILQPIALREQLKNELQKLVKVYE